MPLGEVGSTPAFPLLMTALRQSWLTRSCQHNGRLPRQPPASLETERLLDELQELGWLPVSAEGVPRPTPLPR